MAYLDEAAGRAREVIDASGVPSAGTNEVQSLTQSGSPTGGTFRILFRGVTSDTIAHNAAAATVQTALRAMSSIGATGVTCGGGALGAAPVTVTFDGSPHQRRAQPLLKVVDNLLTGGTNPTILVAETTPGVTATGRGKPKGHRYTNLATGITYINTGTPEAPTWTVVGAQT
jgi:hypothetical protein